MKKQDFMKVRGIGKQNGESFYRDCEGYEDGIFYWEDKPTNLLFRQVLPQDLELVRKARITEANKFVAYKQEKGTVKVSLLGQVIKETDEYIKEIISKSFPESNPEGSMSLVIFNMKTGEFVALMDVVSRSCFGDDVSVGFTFSANKVLKKRYESIVKKRVKELFEDAKITSGELKEEFFNGKDYEPIPMQI